MEQKISIQDVLDWKSSHKLVYASDSESKKKLYVTLCGGYQVEHKSKIILETIDIKTAIEKYESIK